ncbi:hypothetical protein FIBSPDRAFT_935237 [Athelia psychrophila]|uniref:Uncharacterized protein n=1 Tax=Athelia psychrophila TaxID=1759441 RepID=A0A166E5C7_9AGAM|nr:hypothetical protein FIBSPDRAFT_935237 [Fibularhizoctonia sp. CBS 109695]
MTSALCLARLLLFLGSVECAVLWMLRMGSCLADMVAHDRCPTADFWLDSARFGNGSDREHEQHDQAEWGDQKNEEAAVPGVIYATDEDGNEKMGKVREVQREVISAEIHKFEILKLHILSEVTVYAMDEDDDSLTNTGLICGICPATLEASILGSVEFGERAHQGCSTT